MGQGEERGAKGGAGNLRARRPTRAERNVAHFWRLGKKKLDFRARVSAWIRRDQTCYFREHATSVPAECGGGIHNISRNRARTQVLLQAQKLHIYGSGTFGAFWIEGRGLPNVPLLSICRLHARRVRKGSAQSILTSCVSSMHPPNYNAATPRLLFRQGPAQRNRNSTYSRTIQGHHTMRSQYGIEARDA